MEWLDVPLYLDISEVNSVYNKDRMAAIDATKKIFLEKYLFKQITKIGNRRSSLT